MKWRAVLFAALWAAPAAAAVQQAPAKSIDPRADKVLRSMSDYLGGLKGFKVDSTATDEVVLKSGQKIQHISRSQTMVSRPNMLYSRRIGAAGADAALWYDGRTASIFCGSTNSYAVTPVPPKLDDTIDVLRRRYDIEAPGADLLYSNPHKILTEDATEGEYLGREVIDGVQTHHLAYRGPDVDWQLWVKDGPQPLPVRYVITTKDVKSQPQFTVELTNWQTNVSLPADTFVFRPPAGAQRVEAAPAMCPAKP
jgi:hypothetical protein